MFLDNFRGVKRVSSDDISDATYNLWIIGNDSTVFSWNDGIYCSSTYFPANGECGFGWNYWNENRGYSEIDGTASVLCTTPRPMVNLMPNTSVCSKYELTSNKLRGPPLGEYVKMEILHNEKAVFQKVDPENSLYLYFSSHYPSGWFIGEFIGSERVWDANAYCTDLEYPNNKECNVGWFYHSGRTNQMEYDSSMAFVCTEYF